MRRARLMIAVVLVLSGLVSYWSSRETNPITGEVQAIALSPEQEVALGLQSAPQMAAEFGGPDRDARAQAMVASVGGKLVAAGPARDTAYQFRFTLLADAQTVNAFALPGGPIFITRALYDRLENEAQLAGVLGHEIGHVVARHTAARIAKSQLAQAIVGAVGVAASDDSGYGGRQAQAVANVVAQVTQLRYGRKDEIQSDVLGVDFVAAAGWDPRALLRVMEILEEAAAGSRRQPEILASHPDPGDRRERIQQRIAERFPDGSGAELTLGARLR